MARQKKIPKASRIKLLLERANCWLHATCLYHFSLCFQLNEAKNKEAENLAEVKAEITRVSSCIFCITFKLVPVFVDPK